jgi:hypothetical protein
VKTTVRLLVWFTCLVTLTLAKGASFIEGITEPPRCVSPCVMNGNLEFELTGNLGDRFELLEADTVDSAT